MSSNCFTIENNVYQYLVCSSWIGIVSSILYAISINRLGADQGATKVKSTVGVSALTLRTQKPTATKPRIAFIILGVAMLALLFMSKSEKWETSSSVSNMLHRRL